MALCARHDLDSVETRDASWVWVPFRGVSTALHALVEERNSPQLASSASAHVPSVHEVDEAANMTDRAEGPFDTADVQDDWIAMVIRQAEGFTPQVLPIEKVLEEAETENVTVGTRDVEDWIASAIRQAEGLIPEAPAIESVLQEAYTENATVGIGYGEADWIAAAIRQAEGLIPEAPAMDSALLDMNLMVLQQQLAMLDPNYGEDSKQVPSERSDTPTVAVREVEPRLDPVPSARFALMVQDVTAWREADGWRIPITAQLIHRSAHSANASVHMLPMVPRFLRRLGMLGGLDEDALRRYENRARLVIPSLDLLKELRGRRIEVRIASSEVNEGLRSASAWRELPATDRDGRTVRTYWFSDDDVDRLDNPEGRVRVEVRLVGDSSTPPANAVVRLVGEVGVTVISDIDDTVKVTEVFRGYRQVLANTFLRKFKSVDGMASLFRSWEKLYDANFEYVSKSPPELRGPLERFLDREGFPVDSVHLCPLLSGGRNTFKERRIEAILRRFPNRTFVLVGDSGERDAADFAGIFRRHPAQIEKIIIRQVSPKNVVDRTLFRGIPRQKWQVFSEPSEVTLPTQAKPSWLNAVSKWPSQWGQLPRKAQALWQASMPDLSDRR